MKRRNLLALLCAAVLMLAPAACNAENEDTAQLATSAPASVSGGADVSRGDGSGTRESGSRSNPAGTSTASALSSAPASKDGASSRTTGEESSWDTCHVPQAPTANERTTAETPSQPPAVPDSSAEQVQSDPLPEDGSTASPIPMTEPPVVTEPPEWSDENFTWETEEDPSPELLQELDRLVADAKAHGDLTFDLEWGSVAAVPEHREYPVGTSSIRADIVVNRPGEYCMNTLKNAYLLQKKVDGQWVTVPFREENIVEGLVGMINKYCTYPKYYDLTICDPAWMTAGEYRILDGENLDRTDGIEPVQFTFSFSLVAD